MNFCPKNMFIIYVLNCLLFVLLFQNIKSLEKEEDIGDKYDLREEEEYKECESLIDIRDQGKCGGCWAFAAAEVISDRICIESKGKKKPIISENELITCCYDCFNKTSSDKKGCGGGNHGWAYLYWIYSGLPTEECKPFPRYDTEKEYNADNLECLPYCENGSTPIRYYGSDYGYIIKKESEKTDIDIIKRDEKRIMKEIRENGPVSASFKVYGNDTSNDFGQFFNRKNGNEIYGSTSEDALKKKYGKPEGHVIKIIGWGSDKGVKYWLCANSWGRDWGDNGFFKFKRGENYLDIESAVVFGYLDSDFIFRSKESMVVYEDNFFNFKNFNEDFM